MIYFTADAYAAALAVVLPKATPNQRKVLRVHLEAAGHTMTARELAEAVGWNGPYGTNLQYGRFASALCRALGVEVDGDKIAVLVEFLSPDGAEETGLRLRPAVVEALQRFQLS